MNATPPKIIPRVQPWQGKAVLLALLLTFWAIPCHANQLGNVQVTWRSTVSATTQREFESVLKNGRGTVISEARLTRLIETTLSILADYGYRHAVIEPQNFHLIGDSLSFGLVVTPGIISDIARWELLGLLRTDSLWLAKVLDLQTGIPATSQKINDALSQLATLPNLTWDGPPEIVIKPGESSVVVRLKIREQPPARFEGAVAAGSSDGPDQAILGRFSLSLSGLFRRGHSLAMEYQNPVPDERLMRIDYRESFAFWRNLSTHVQFEDWRRRDHRQQVGTHATVGLMQGHPLNLVVGIDWQKITPLISTDAAARVYESSLGLVWGRERGSNFSITTTYSQHRRWGHDSDIAESSSRLRIESHGEQSLDVDSRSKITLSAGARWWGGGDDLRAGDEWFLGGKVLSGYAERTLLAKSGAWSRLEVTRGSPSGLGASLFGDLAWLSMFEGSYNRPASYGFAFLLNSPARSGRLELAWRDHATLRDGILRLSVIQGW